ncbi:hypothetical protein ACERK3_15920 [Phycisphaerales bacterium AB-hyl4]|uniref:Uncharacterized protein n=1 Tax=Natronomicrosphaera hydrolytica TaxID=3242702 RepID=A0ABV4UAA8_9BACT
MSQAPAPPSLDSDVQTIASRQKSLLVCILIYLLTIVGQFVVPAEVRPLLAVGVLVVGLVAMVFVFLLATKLYGIGIGILLGLLTLIPLVGLIILLAVNARATHTLRRNGIEVGLLGAKMP